MPEATACAVLDRPLFETMMRSLPAFALSITGALAERLDRANQHVGVEFMSLARVKVDPRVLTLLPQPLVNEHRVVPVAFCNNRLTLAMTNPNNVVAFDDVRRIVKGVLIERFLVTSSTIGVVAQRLARRVCQACKEAYVAEPETCRFFGLPEGATLYRGRGCTACGGSGVKGRIGIYEVMRMTRRCARWSGVARARRRSTRRRSSRA